VPRAHNVRVIFQSERCPLTIAKLDMSEFRLNTLNLCKQIRIEHEL